MIEHSSSNDNQSIIDLTPSKNDSFSRDRSADSTRSCKFILVRYGDIVRLVFGDLTAYRYHAHLLRKFCDDRNIEYSANHGDDVVEPLDMSVSVAGGGLLELDYVKNIALFTGSSKAYGPYSRTRLESVLECGGPLKGMKISIK